MPWTGMDNREVARFFLPALEITGPRAEAQEAIGWKGFCFFWGFFFRWCLYLACHLWPGLMRRVAGVRSRLGARLTLKEKIEKGEECKLSLGAGSAALCLFKR